MQPVDRPPTNNPTDDSEEALYFPSTPEEARAKLKEGRGVTNLRVVEEGWWAGMAGATFPVPDLSKTDSTCQAGTERRPCA